MWGPQIHSPRAMPGAHQHRGLREPGLDTVPAVAAALRSCAKLQTKKLPLSRGSGCFEALLRWGLPVLHGAAAHSKEQSSRFPSRSGTGLWLSSGRGGSEAVRSGPSNGALTSLSPACLPREGQNDGSVIPKCCVVCHFCRRL